MRFGKVGNRAAKGVLAILLLIPLCQPLSADTLKAGLSDGELPFRLRSFSFPAAGDSTRVLVLATLRADLLHWARSDSLRANLDLDWEIHSGGRIRGEKREHLHLTRSLDMERIEGQVLVTAEWILSSGAYRVEFHAEDPGRKRGGFLGLFGHPPTGRWSGRIEAHDYAPGELSDILLYTVGADSLSSPNPWSSFVEGDPYLEIFSVLRPVSTDEAWLGVTLDLLDSEGLRVLRKRGGWRPGAEPFPLRLRLPLSGLESGDYSLALKPSGPGLSTDPVLVEFQILPRAGRSGSQQLLDEVQAGILMDEKQVRAWNSLPPAQRSEELRRLWEIQDPDPREPGNPAREKFFRRFRQAYRRFGGFQPGPLSDRGRMWILLGEPDEIEVDVLPENKTSLLDAISEIHGAEIPNTPNLALEHDLGRAGLGGPGSPGVESEAFEMWTYRLGGDPLLPDLSLELREVDLKLIFVDRSGTGEYVLEFSSEKFDF